MIKKIISILNLIIMVSLILIFEHIERFSYFGNLYPYIGVILISFTVYFSLTMPYFLKKPHGLHVLLIGAIFICFQSFSSTAENLRTSFIFISFIVIATIVVKNSDHKKLKILLRIITYCCLINLIYAIYSILVGTSSIGATFRIGGLDGTPVLFGYNMLLGFWLVLINSMTNPVLSNKNSKLDKFFAFAFVVGILLSQSRGAFFGLTSGIIAIFFYQAKIKTKVILQIVVAIFLIIITYINFPLLFWDSLGIKRLASTFSSIGNEERFILWQGMLNSYFDQLNFVKLLFGGGQGYGTDLIQRGVHSEHLKLIFDYGLIGLSIYCFKVWSWLKLIREFNIYLVGFVVSTFASGFFYVNMGSITNSFSYIIVIIILSNYSKFETQKTKGQK